jgi:hypothetical protein
VANDAEALEMTLPIHELSKARVAGRKRIGIIRGISLRLKHHYVKSQRIRGLPGVFHRILVTG